MDWFIRSGLGMPINYTLGLFDRALEPSAVASETYRRLRAERSKG